MAYFSSELECLADALRRYRINVDPKRLREASIQFRMKIPGLKPVSSIHAPSVPPGATVWECDTTPGELQAYIDRVREKIAAEKAAQTVAETPAPTKRAAKAAA